MKKIILGSLACFGMVACTPPATDTDTSTSIQNTEKAVSHLDLAAICNKSWQKAAETYRVFESNSTAESFKAWVDAIPDKPKDVTSVPPCSNQNIIMNALQSDFKKVAAPNTDVFDFTRMLLKVQHISEGSLAEELCHQGALQIKKDAVAFLKALKQEEMNASDLSCFLTSAKEFVEASESYKDGLEGRARKIKAVKATELKEIKEKSLEILDKRIHEN